MKYTKQFFSDAAERAISTFIQTLLVLIGSDTANLLTLDWKGILAASVSAAVLSVLKSVGAVNFGNAGTASLSKAVIAAPAVVNPVVAELQKAQALLDRAQKLKSDARAGR